jgi:hypothetical protein
VFAFNFQLLTAGLFPLLTIPCPPLTSSQKYRWLCDKYKFTTVKLITTTKKLKIHSFEARAPLQAAVRAN